MKFCSLNACQVSFRRGFPNSTIKKPEHFHVFPSPSDLRSLSLSSVLAEVIIALHHHQHQIHLKVPCPVSIVMQGACGKRRLLSSAWKRSGFSSNSGQSTLATKHPGKFSWSLSWNVKSSIMLKTM